MQIVDKTLVLKVFPHAVLSWWNFHRQQFSGVVEFTNSLCQTKFAIQNGVCTEWCHYPSICTRFGRPLSKTQNYSVINSGEVAIYRRCIVCRRSEVQHGVVEIVTILMQVTILVPGNDVMTPRCIISVPVPIADLHNAESLYISAALLLHPKSLVCCCYEHICFPSILPRITRSMPVIFLLNYRIEFNCESVSNKQMLMFYPVMWFLLDCWLCFFRVMHFLINTCNDMYATVMTDPCTEMLQLIQTAMAFMWVRMCSLIWFNSLRVISMTNCLLALAAWTH